MTDTRRQILQTIRDQAKLLQQTSSERHPHVHVWSIQQWWEAFQFLFITCVTPVDSTHHDDLLFFVKSEKHPAQSPPFFVRRKAKQLPQELQLSGKDFDTVSWADSVLLNNVLQSQYQLTVVACGREALPFVAEGRTWSPDMITVTKPVYASTTITAVNLDSSRAEASNPEPCYPDICFAVDNFDNAFEDLVLEHADRCYCVILHAILDHDDSVPVHPDADLDMTSNSLPSSKTAAAGGDTQHQAQNTSSSTTAAGNHAAAPAAGHSNAARNSSGDGSPWQIGTRRRTLFAGYVSYGQILDFLDANMRNKTILEAFWGSKGPQQDKVVMTGPGGVGRCEVAVKKVAQQGNSSASSRPGSAGPGSSAGGTSQLAETGKQAAATGPAAAEKQRGLLQLGLHKARSFASGVQQALSDINQAEGVACNMQCALMLLKLPVKFLATELLDAA